ncbi:MAG: tape measure protein [bacterium]
MQDNSIKYQLDVVGGDKAVAELNKVAVAGKNASKAINGNSVSASTNASSTDKMGSAANKAAQATDNASKSQKGFFMHIARTTIQSALVNKLFLEMVDVAGQAVQQVDLMKNFPNTMASMGQSTQDASVAMAQLTRYVGAVGGNIGDATSYVTRFVGATQDVKSATAIFEGLNNALIAGDSSAEERNQAMIQFAQALERGKPDMREWRTLTQNMSFQLNQVAKSMGYVNANDLGTALTTGKESMANFTTELTKLSLTGPIADQARVRMTGMQFAFDVMKNTMVQGVAAIINAFNRANIVGFFNFLTQVIQVLSGWVVTLINLFGSLVNMISHLFGGPDIFGSIKSDATDVASSIGAGASAAGDLGDGLDSAGDSAKKLNKQLSSFDKMNVLADKTSGGGKDKAGAGAGGSNFDPAMTSKLKGLFDGVTGGIKEATIWAKIFGGVLASIAGAFTLSKIADQFNNLVKRIDDTTKNLNRLKDAFTGVNKESEKTSKTIGEKVASGLGKGSSALGSFFGGIAGGIATMFTSVLVPALSAAGTIILDAVWTYILFPVAAAVGALAGILGLSIGATILVIGVIIAAIVAVIWLIWTNWNTIWSWMKTAFTFTVNFFVEVWNTLYDIFAGPIKFLLQFWTAVFTLVVAVVATALELVFKLVVGAITLIYNVLSAIVGWIYTNLIQPVLSVFAELWRLLVAGVTNTFNWILNSVLLPIANWINNNVIQPVWQFFQWLWDTVSGAVSGFAITMYGFLGPVVNWIRDNVISPIAGLFSGLWSGIKTGLEAMWEGLRTIFGSLGGIIKSPINGVIDLINQVLASLNRNVKVPDWVPGLGGSGVNFPMIPKLAQGGVVQKATLAMIGESGAEAVVPLENNTEWLDKLAAKINASGGNGQPIQLTVQIGEERILTKLIDLINEKTQMSGRNTILV